MRRLPGILAGGALAITAGAAPAQAADTLPGDTGSAFQYMGWRSQTTRVCFNYPDTGSLRTQVSRAVNTWNASQATVVRRANCAASGFRADETVKMAFAPGSKFSGKWCGVTPGGGLGGTVQRTDAGDLYVRMKLTGTSTIWINQDLTAGCRTTSGMWQHLITHELGHRLGFGHDEGGVMGSGSWSYADPTPKNIDDLNLLY